EPVAQVWLQLARGDQVEINGKAEALMPSPNGFATLQLPPGEYQFRISNGRQTRSQTITLEHEGAWLLNPQSSTPARRRAGAVFPE
ncbi:hypothetical protein LXA65_18140, partial [Erwinia amylovora]|nr:hypothetical protein [Erwinia amylovora]